MALNRSFKLNNGDSIPAVGFGTWLAKPNEVEHAVEVALKSGYRHIDGAAIYRNEAEVGQGIKKSGVPRKDVFVTTKLWNNGHDPKDVETALDKSLKDLNLDYVDLYLMHWPVAFVPSDNLFPLDGQGVFRLADIPVTETWKAMEALLKTGKVKAIGVSNFNIRRLKELLSFCQVKPVVNQIEAHPYFQQHELFDFCKQNDILIQAYSPLGNNLTGEPKTMDDAVVHEVGKQLDMDPGQVCISWGVQRGTVVLPKSVTDKRIASNFQDKILPDWAMEKVSALERNKRFNFPGMRWGFDIFDEVGDEKVKQGAQDAAPQNLKMFTTAK